MRYLNEFIADVINDYEQSIIGAFAKDLILKLNSLEAEPKAKVNGQDQAIMVKRFDLYMSITKFKSDIGYSLV